METGGYLLAYIIANYIVAIYAIIAGKGYKAFSFHNIDRCKLKEMIRYSVVLIPNTFMWWIMNSSDRVMVTYMIGAAANGIYAVSYKLPTLVSTLTGIYNQAWSYSAIREEGTSDETEYNNKMFKTLSAIAFIAFSLISIAVGFEEIGIFSFILTGALMGFLIFNTHPAKIFMGDTGSLALGAVMAAVAILTHREVTLLVVASVFVIETLSVILQVVWLRLFKHKLFLMTPLHHHFEKLGWEETDIVKLFWVVGLILTIAGILIGVWL